MQDIWIMQDYLFTDSFIVLVQKQKREVMGDGTPEGM